MNTVRVTLPAHLRALARVQHEVEVHVGDAATVAAVLDALEERYPMLRGTIRESGSGRRRAFIRYFACGTDISHEPPETPLPPAVAEGREALCVIGAISGG
jgi:sulfur-carrier protein